jgi:sensor histidine kinase YesM
MALSQVNGWGHFSIHMFSHRHRYLFVFLLSLYTFFNTLLCDVYHYFHITIAWYLAFLTIIGITLLTWEGNRIAEPYLKKRLLTSRSTISYFILFFFTGNAIAIVVTFFMVYLVGTVLQGYSWEQNTTPLKLNFIYAVLINLLFHLLNAIVYFFREYKRQWAEAEELRRISAQAQVQLIKSQINPHFLFNNLNVLSGMVIKDNPEANHFIEEFSKVYRYILNNQEKELVELRSELDFIQPYLFLLKKRFDEGLMVDINIPDAYKTLQVVPAALQMLIENAIKHNIVSRHKPLRISIYTNGNQTLVIKNNLQPRQLSESSTRIGLQNIQQRYELISGRSVSVNKTMHEFEVVLPLLNLT